MAESLRINGTVDLCGASLLCHFRLQLLPYDATATLLMLGGVGTTASSKGVELKKLLPFARCPFVNAQECGLETVWKSTV